MKESIFRMFICVNPLLMKESEKIELALKAILPFKILKRLKNE